MRLKKIKIKNTTDVDKVVRNAFGEEIIIYPGQQVIVMVLDQQRRKKNGKQ